MSVTFQTAVKSLAIRTLGGLAIGLGDGAHLAAVQPIKFEARTAEALLVYLACQGRPVARDTLAELLWPERTQKQAHTNLRVAIHRLRQQLEPYLLVTRQHVAVHPDAPLWLDCAQFEAQFAASALADATALYTGDFLDGFYLDGSPAFEYWALLERERLRTLAIAAYQQRIEQQSTQGQRDAAIATAQRLLQLDPLHESTHRHLMRLLAQTGQRSAALAQYETCLHLLGHELDALPDDTTTALYEQIRAGDGRLMDDPLQARGTDQSIRVNGQAQSVHPHNLPPQSTPFIGRESELQQIALLLANPDCRLLSLLGTGGMGKTRLAIEAATQQVDSFADGVYFVPLAAVGTPAFMLTALAESLNLTLGPGEVRAQIASYLRSRHLLLVLDNFEHLVDVADDIALLLRHAPHLKVLVTTRTRLQLLEEWLLPVDGFCVDDNLLGPAAQLFLRSAQRVQPAFAANGQGEAITAICRQVGGMPLAIELAASWVRVMPCAEIACQLARNFDLLSTAVRNLPERHRSMHALFDQSWRLLSPQEQKVLRRLSVFQGGWTLEEATAVTEATLALLLSLVDKALVRSNGQNRYDLHELVRQYAAEQLTASGEQESIQQRHFATYLTLLRAADHNLRGPLARAWFDRLETEQGNVRAALHWALDHERYADVAWMGIALAYFWRHRLRWHEALAWLEPTLAHAHAWSLELRLANLLNLHNAAAWEQNPKVDGYATELHQLARACKSKVLRAHTLFLTSLFSADVTQATNSYIDAIALVRQSEEADPLGAEFCVFSERALLLAELLMRYGLMLRSRGEYAQAQTFFAESLAVFRARDDHGEISYTLGNLGRLALIQGNLAQAECLLGEAATRVEILGDTMGITDCQPYFALVKLYQGQVDEAWQLLQASLAVCHTLKYPGQARKTFAVAAMVALQQGKLDQAEAFLSESLAYYQGDWVRPELVDCLFTAARLATAQAQFERAATIFGLAERLRGEIHHALDAPMRPLVEAALATVCAKLDPAIFAEAFSTGQAISLEEAYSTLLAST